MQFTIGAIGLCAIFSGSYLYLESRTDPPRLIGPPQTITHPQLNQPSDIVKFDGSYVASELRKNRLAIFDDLNFSNLRHFDPRSINKKFKSPHFMEVTPWNTLLISNGWGSSIIEIADLNGSQWKEFSGMGKKFRAPHGICVDEQGWIYVGDSLNSRLVRFRDMQGKDWQVFSDSDRKISYTRELVCNHDGIWISNSYEKRKGLNPGKGSNVLKITDFESGKVEIVWSVSNTNITGALPVNQTELLVGIWGNRQRLILADLSKKTSSTFSASSLGIPYGTFKDQDNSLILVAHLGQLSKNQTNQIGGFTFFHY